MKPKFKKITAVFAALIIFLFNNIFATATFINESSRFILKNSNSQIKFNQTTVNGWKNNSIIQRLTIDIEVIPKLSFIPLITEYGHSIEVTKGCDQF